MIPWQEGIQTGMMHTVLFAARLLLDGVTCQSHLKEIAHGVSVTLSTTSFKKMY